MSFHEEVFPLGIAYGAIGGPKFKTTVLTLASGFEKRNIDWSRSRAEYDVSYGLKTQAELEEIRRFFYARRGRAYGFRFRDWQDYQLNNQTIGITGGSQSQFQVFKRYQSGTIVYDRVINKIEAGSVTLTVNGVVVSEGVGTSQYLIDLNTGIVTLGSALVTPSGRAVAITCKFHVPVRFDTDHLNTTLEEYNVHSWGQIPLVEVRL